MKYFRKLLNDHPYEKGAFLKSKPLLMENFLKKMLSTE